MTSLVLPVSLKVTPAPAAASKPPLWRRVVDAMVAAQQRRAERDVVRYLEVSGLKFTDFGRTRDRAAPARPSSLKITTFSKE